MFIKNMSYITLASEQITSNKGELSIDIFSKLDGPDDSKFTINCNSYRDEGLLLNCPNGGIQISSNELDITNKITQLKNKDFKCECSNEFNLECFNKIKLASLKSIELSNSDDGFFFDIIDSKIKIINTEFLGKILISANDILIGNSETYLSIKKSNLKLKFNDQLEIYANDNKIIEIKNENKNIEINGNVFINGKLHFNKLETSKINKIKLDSIYNILEFGNQNSKIADWNIKGYHVDSISEINFNYLASMFELKFNQKYADLKIGNLCIENNHNNLFLSDENGINIDKLDCKFIKVNKLDVVSEIYCKDIYIDNIKFSDQNKNIYNHTTNLEYFSRGKEYILLDCDINQNLVTDIDFFNYIGQNRNIVWKNNLINIRNVTKKSSFKNIDFENMKIHFKNCVNISFNDCSFVNCELHTDNSFINMSYCNIDNNSTLKLEKLSCINCDLKSNIQISKKINITNSNIYLTDNNLLKFTNATVIYQLIHNYIYIPEEIENHFISENDVILIENWIISLFKNKSIFEKNYIIKNRYTNK